MSTVQEIESAIQRLRREEQEAVCQWLEDFLEDQLEFTDQFQQQIAESERSMSEGRGRVHKPGH